MKHYITIALCIFLSQISSGQVMMMFSSDSLVNITSPLDLDSLFYWFAADQGVTDSLGGAIANNEGVGTWADLSGNGYDVTQGTNGARPVYKATGGPASKPAIQFDGSNDFLSSVAHFWGSDDLTVFTVMKFANATKDAQEFFLGKYETSSPANSRSWVFQGTAAVSGYRIAYQGSDDGTSTAGQFWQYTYGEKSTTWKLHSFSDDDANTTTNKLWYEDGSSVSVNAATSTQAKDQIYDSSATKLGVGAINVTSAATLFFQGSISEIIVYSRALTTAERQAIETYLNRKYDLY